MPENRINRDNQEKLRRKEGVIALIVNIVAALQALFYLCAIPVHLAVRVDGLRVGAGLAAFERRAARRRADRELAAPAGQSGASPDVRRALRLLKRLQIERVELVGRVALGDAAATAILCGMIGGLARAFRGRVRRMRVDVRPDFASQRVVVEMSGMIQARAGQIILAAINLLTEEAFPWISTRLKT